MTVLVDIAEKDLINLWALSDLNLRSFDEQGHQKLFKEYSITFYQNRIESLITVQIPLDLFILFKGYDLVRF